MKSKNKINKTNILKNKILANSNEVVKIAESSGWSLFDGWLTQRCVLIIFFNHKKRYWDDAYFFLKKNKIQDYDHWLEI